MLAEPAVCARQGRTWLDGQLMDAPSAERSASADENLERSAKRQRYCAPRALPYPSAKPCFPLLCSATRVEAPPGATQEQRCVDRAARALQELACFGVAAAVVLELLAPAGASCAPHAGAPMVCLWTLCVQSDAGMLMLGGCAQLPPIRGCT